MLPKPLSITVAKRERRVQKARVLFLSALDEQPFAFLTLLGYAKEKPMRIGHAFWNLVLANVLAASSSLALAIAPKPRVLEVIFIAGILQDDVDNFDSEQLSSDALTAAIVGAPQYSTLLARYDEINHSFLANWNDQKSDLYLSKVNEELYLDDYRAALKAGSYYAPRDANKLSSIYSDRLSGESPYFAGFITVSKNKVCFLLKEGRDVVLVAHSHGNIAANLIYAGVAKGCGTFALDHLRVVSVGSVAQIAPNNLMVNQAGDRRVYVQMPAFGLLWTRDTPYCKNTCLFTAPPPTVNSNCSGILEWDCHKFVDHYLSDELGTKYVGYPILGQRLSSSAHFSTKVTGGPQVYMQRLVTDAFYTAVDSIHKEAHGSDIWYDKFWARSDNRISGGDVTSAGDGQFEIHSAGGYTTRLTGQQQYTQGGIVNLEGCIAQSSVSGGGFHLMDMNFDFIFNIDSGFAAQPSGGVTVTWVDGASLLLVDALNGIRRVQAAKQDGRYCGKFSFGICPDKSTFSQFTNSLDGQVYRQWSAGPAPDAIRRFMAFQFKDDVMSITSIVENPLVFPAPRGSKKRPIPSECSPRHGLPLP